jgi:FMN-dependent NADH-azoreductase
MNILHISCSPRGVGAGSYRLSQRIIDALLQRHPQATVVQRALWAAPQLHVDAGYALALASGGVDTQAAPGSALATSDAWIRELEAADCVVIATPLHNFTVPATLKNWIDHVVRIGRTFVATPEGKVGLLAGRPVYVAVSSGGFRTGEHARSPDFLEPYLRAILATIGLAQVHFFSLQAQSLGDALAARHAALAQDAVADHFAAGAQR